ncbi:MAG: hypothetical protein F4053_14855 [Proteobacteria bacterium]|nr:hypothetical protein [Pseudomonadota bacterium]
MSIGIELYPKTADKQGLKALLVELGFVPAKHLFDRSKAALHFRWFSDFEYQSYDGVEATIFSPAKTAEAASPPCAWALHTRTRASASPADRKHQNLVVRTARAEQAHGFSGDPGLIGSD